MTSQNNPPDLNSILRTLSAFSNQANTHSQPPSNHETNENDHDYEPPDARPPVTQSHIQPQPRSYSQSQPQQQPQLHYQPGQAPPPISLSRQPRKESPSSTITTWPAALKQVMRTVGQNEEIQRRIRFLIQRQHHHEKQWWKGREVLLQKQKSRKEKKKELDEVLYASPPLLSLDEVGPFLISKSTI
ncbi:hypothetical protein BJY04DRAFT_85424 [Aspergillus karnatakaensis]|uniref:uncharacterized protein n=1 Tax=Aspergillus karnatakaensis TaxID=1810916 RepID=UPI003CCDC40D